MPKATSSQKAMEFEGSSKANFSTIKTAYATCAISILRHHSGDRDPPITQENPVTQGWWISIPDPKKCYKTGLPAHFDPAFPVLPFIIRIPHTSLHAVQPSILHFAQLLSHHLDFSPCLATMWLFRTLPLILVSLRGIVAQFSVCKSSVNRGRLFFFFSPTQRKFLISFF